ncbi:MAG: flagellar basal body P-ring formation chaperone FlgA [Pseudomonadota bacterium]
MNRFLSSSEAHQRRPAPGFIAFLFILMWFLLAVLTATPAAADDSVLRAQDVLPDIEIALDDRGMPDNAVISLDEPDRIIGANADFANVSYNARSGRFIIRMADSANIISGLANVAASYPVLSRNLARGEVITSRDIDFTEAKMRAGDYISDAASLEGMSARRPLKAGALLRRSDVAAPILVKRGAMVTLIYEIEGLRMTHQGVAQRDGAAGAVIPVTNIDSDRTLKGVVSAKNMVSVVAGHSELTLSKGSL